MQRRLTTGELVDRETKIARIKTLVQQLGQQYGREAVQRAARYCNKKQGAPKRLNDVRVLSAWSIIEAWRHHLGQPDKPASVLSACKKAARCGGLAIPHKIAPGGLGDFAIPGKWGKKVLPGSSVFNVARGVVNLRKYHRDGEALLKRCSTDDVVWWHERAIRQAAVVKKLDPDFR
jgi:hypothetical protein